MKKFEQKIERKIEKKNEKNLNKKSKNIAFLWTAIFLPIDSILKAHSKAGISTIQTIYTEFYIT